MIERPRGSDANALLEFMEEQGCWVLRLAVETEVEGTRYRRNASRGVRTPFSNLRTTYAYNMRFFSYWKSSIKVEGCRSPDKHRVLSIARRIRRRLLHAIRGVSWHQGIANLAIHQRVQMISPCGASKSWRCVSMSFREVERLRRLRWKYSSSCPPPVTPFKLLCSVGAGVLR